MSRMLEDQEKAKDRDAGLLPFVDLNIKFKYSVISKLYSFQFSVDQNSNLHWCISYPL